tara:strand:+ start:2297 stop:2485 length:189 start_codon:yes stop_codon:yes gene_type:complete
MQVKQDPKQEIEEILDEVSKQFYRKDYFELGGFMVDLLNSAMVRREVIKKIKEQQNKGEACR